MKNAIKKLLQKNMEQLDTEDERYRQTIFQSKIVNFSSIIVSDKLKKVRIQVDYNNPSNYTDKLNIIERLKMLIENNF